MNSDIIEIKYALDTFYFLMSGVLVMWMAAGFSMLEAVWSALKTPLKFSPKMLRCSPSLAVCIW